MSIRTTVLLAAAALAASSSAVAQQKDAAYNEMLRLEQQINRLAVSNPAAVAPLKLRHEALRQQLFGVPSASTGAIDPTAVSTPSNAVAPAYNIPGPCGGLESGTPGTTVTASSSPALAILDNVTVSDSLAISGLGTQTFDVDLTVAITHTWTADMNISLTSPAGTVVDVSSGNGGSTDDVFNGTLFDDQSANSVTSYAYVSGVAAPDLRPEASFNDNFRGENPNGTWTLSIADTAGGDVGTLHTWSLAVTDGSIVSIPPALGSPTTYSTGPIAVSILDNATATAPLALSGATTNIVDVNVYVEITHTWSADMLIQVQSPLGTTIDLSNRRGGSTDNVFNGTMFDMSSPNLIGSYAFVNNVVATSLRPDGNLNLFAGEDANGTWNLLVNDNAGGDIGTIHRWDLVLTGCLNVVNYCTAGTSTNGCNATMGSNTGAPSVSAGAGSFLLSVSNVEGQKSALIFYGLTGRHSAPWYGASTSFLCVKSPTQRTGAGSTGGTVDTCDGSLSLDFFGELAAHPAWLGNPVAAGQVYDAQCWYRDPPAPKTTNLSDGIEFTLVP